MTTRANVPVNTRLPLVPAITNLSPQAYEELLKIYASIRTLSQTIAVYTGTEIRTKEVQQELAEEDIRNTVVVNNYSSLYIRMAVSASYGQIISLNSSGQGILSRYSTASGSDAFLPLGFLEEESIAAGQIARICTRGIIAVNGVTPMASYIVSPFAVSAGFLILKDGLGVTTFPEQRVAVGISSDKLFYHGIASSRYTTEV